MEKTCSHVEAVGFTKRFDIISWFVVLSWIRNFCTFSIIWRCGADLWAISLFLSLSVFKCGGGVSSELWECCEYLNFLSLPPPSIQTKHLFPLQDLSCFLIDNNGFIVLSKDRSEVRPPPHLFLRWVQEGKWYDSQVPIPDNWLRFWTLGWGSDPWGWVLCLFWNVWVFTENLPSGCFRL